MAMPHERRRILVTANSQSAAALHDLFTHPTLQEWDMQQADSLSQSRFVLQHNPCDVLLISGEVVEREGAHGLAWLAQRGDRPIVYLAGNDPASLTRAYEYGVDICVPQQLTANRPELLAAALNRAVAASKLQRRHRQMHRQLQCSRRDIDRLVGLIWRTTPHAAHHQWYPQRFALERLQEELARTQRHGVPLSVAIGEVAATNNDAQVNDWTATVLSRVKRRSDVAGQYGLRGFILVMLHTAKEGGMACCRRIREMLEGPSPERPTDPVRVYFGVSSTADREPTAQSLLRWAEHNLELAKQEEHERIVAV